jgi:ribosomal protein S18 acetylase RimI-like enzyme
MSEIFTSGDFSKYAKYADLAAARGPIKDILDKAKEVARRIHEKYEDDKKEPTGNQNCLLCSWCAEAMLRGIDILPRPVYSPRDPALGITPEDMLKESVEKRYFKNFSDMQNWYLNLKNARFYVHVKWSKGNGGHEFLLLNTNVPHVLDAQQGLLSPVVDMKTFKEYFGDIDYNETYMCRIDNHDLDIENLKKINNESAIVAWDEDKDIQYMRDHDMLSDEENFDRVLVPSEEAIKYFKNNKELSSYWEDIAKASEGEFLVTKDTREEIGHVFVHKYKNDKGFIYNVNVEKKFRRQGFGWILIDDAVKKFGGEDLTVDADNTPAVNLYLKYGFKIVDRGYWHNDGKEELWMTYDRSKVKQESYFYEGFIDKLLDNRMGPRPNEPAYNPSVLLQNKEYILKFINPNNSNVFSVSAKNMQQNIFDELNRLMIALAYSKDFDSYDKHRRFLCELLNWPTDHVIQPVTWRLGAQDFLLQIKPDKDFGNKRAITETDFLYHTSSVANLKQLQPHFLSSFQSKMGPVKIPRIEALFPSPRIYAHIGKIGNRVGSGDIRPGEHAYRVLYTGEVFTDIELKGTACFINTTNMIPCEEVDPNTKQPIQQMKQTSTQLTTPKPVQQPQTKPTVPQQTSAKPTNSPTQPVQPKQESFQEGASQDIRNGVNPNSKKLFFHVTSDPNLDGQVFKPRVPDYLDEYDPEDTTFENTSTPRVCFSPSIEGCINAIAVNFKRINPIRFEKLYVYIPEKPIQEYRHKTNKELIRDKDVFDANVTREMWILEPVRLKLYGVIRIDQWKKQHRKSTVPNVKNDKDTRPYYTIKWHWLVKPKVVASTEKSQYKYDTSTVCRNLGIDLKKFKYGLIRDGRLITHDITAEDYEKYWRYHTGKEVDEAGGGNCYDMVEYEGGYLDAYGIPYKKYYLAPTYDDKYSSHTFIVVPNNGKFIYIEKAFKMVSDQFENNKKEFDSLDDVFDFLLENICEYERLTTLNYIIIDYTDIEFKSGTDIKHFRDYILNHGDEVRETKYTLEKKGK